VADCALIDLEDGVAPKSKEAARQAVAELVSSLYIYRYIYICILSLFRRTWRDVPQADGLRSDASTQCVPICMTTVGL
jgi:HpcH/HpaI aldolase/citrate lyase family